MKFSSITLSTLNTPNDQVYMYEKVLEWETLRIELRLFTKILLISHTQCSTTKYAIDMQHILCSSFFHLIRSIYKTLPIDERKTALFTYYSGQTPYDRCLTIGKKKGFANGISLFLSVKFECPRRSIIFSKHSMSICWAYIVDHVMSQPWKHQKWMSSGRSKRVLDSIFFLLRSLIFWKERKEMQ